MTQQASRYTLDNRYVFQGELELLTALHIGGGRTTLSSSDSPVVLTPEEIPFIPGSSFKGTMRSIVEKFVPSLPGSLTTCALIELDEQEAKQEERRTGKPLCSTIRQDAITKARRDNPGRVPQILAEARQNLCNTCQLFGSPFAAARVAVNDLYMPEGTWSGVLQLRDGVAIERDSEKAKDRLKYDFEVVPVGATFKLELTLENATPVDLQLISVGLSEFVHGGATLGGKRSRGLGACILKKLHVFALELTGIDEEERNTRLRKYLIKREYSGSEDGMAFLERHISALYESKG